MKPSVLVPFAAVAIATACQEKGATPEAAATPVTASSPAIASAGASLDPQPMELADWKSADLRGELGCGFARDVGEAPILFAASFVDPKATSDAAMKFGGRVVKLSTESKGGFDAMSTGARFAGPDGLFANVVRAGDRIAETPQIAEESPRYPALLVTSRGGRELSIDGFWECGP